jgi:hypothetical protein
LASTDNPNLTLIGCGGTCIQQNATYTLIYTYIPAVPEPAAWAMMLVGLGAVGTSIRYRRRRQTNVPNGLSVTNSQNSR